MPQALQRLGVPCFEAGLRVLGPGDAVPASLLDTEGSTTIPKNGR